MSYTRSGIVLSSVKHQSHTYELRYYAARYELAMIIISYENNQRNEQIISLISPLKIQEWTNVQDGERGEKGDAGVSIHYRYLFDPTKSYRFNDVVRVEEHGVGKLYLYTKKRASKVAARTATIHSISGFKLLLQDGTCQCEKTQSISTEFIQSSKISEQWQRILKSLQPYEQTLNASNCASPFFYAQCLESCEYAIPFSNAYYVPLIYDHVLHTCENVQYVNGCMQFAQAGSYKITYGLRWKNETNIHVMAYLLNPDASDDHAYDKKYKIKSSRCQMLSTHASQCTHTFVITVPLLFRMSILLRLQETTIIYGKEQTWILIEKL